MTNLLKDDVHFYFNQECKEAHDYLKIALVTTLIIRPPEWGMPYEIMCDSSGYAVGAVLG